jgi:hypothetical protein
LSSAVCGLRDGGGAATSGSGLIWGGERAGGLGLWWESERGRGREMFLAEFSNESDLWVWGWWRGGVVDALLLFLRRLLLRQRIWRNGADSGFVAPASCK